ncbi:putative reverse transcriptase domain-containing protein [Tanacetum coccineum]|uniref:Reverse transcriptase domain-containing protein n=1 Tax=Tanacetum coccineum TaxID=301880 RepID=A0ABQ4Z9X0_9ASTR
MTKLTQKSVKFDWGEKTEAAFQLLKQKLYSALILALPKGSENFVVYCDASHKRLGAVLMQRKKVIAYASRQLKVHEKNYTTHDLEPGAIVFALKMWRHNLYSTKCVVFTNDKSLQHILDQKELNMKQRHWLELLSDYDCSQKGEVKVGGSPEIPQWKWENITMDFVTKLPKTAVDQDTIWVIIDRLTKSDHFLPMREDDTLQKLTRQYSMDMSTAYHPETDGQSERTIQTLEDMLRACALNFGKDENPLEFQVGDKVIGLKVSPCKGVIRFGKRGKLNHCYIGPFKIIAKVGTVMYRLELPEKLNRVHSTFHVSNLKKCLTDEPLAIPLDEIQVDNKLHFIEEPVEIMD